MYAGQLSEWLAACFVDMLEDMLTVVQTPAICRQGEET